MRVSQLCQKPLPKLRIAAPIDRMPLIRRHIGQRPEDEGIAQDLISREAIAIDLAGTIAVGQQIKIERAWRETPALALALITLALITLAFRLTTPLTAVLDFDAAQYGSDLAYP